jgi:MFS family permease
MGGVFSAFYLAYTLLMIPGGWLSDRFGPRSTLTIGLFAAAVFTALTALTGLMLMPFGFAYGFLFAVRLAFGAAAAPLFPACARLTANWFPPATTARVQAVIFGVTLFGSALLPIPLTPLMRGLGWQNGFLILGAVTAIVAGVWHMLAENGPPDVHSTYASVLEKQSMRTARSVLLSRNVVLLAVSYGAFSYFVYLLESWTFYYYREIREFGATESASYMSAMLLAGAFTMPLGGWVSDQLTVRFGYGIGRRPVPIFGVLVSVVLIGIGATGLSPLMAAVVLALSYGFLVSGDPVYWAFIIETTGKKAGTACGMLNTGSNAGGILAPILSPWLAGMFGWNIALYVGALIACLGICRGCSSETLQRTCERVASHTTWRHCDRFYTQWFAPARECCREQIRRSHQMPPARSVCFEQNGGSRFSGKPA